ncbi:efflux RND transporter periplasmic adaptor subunit [Candidatus Beckwithbacteria bacterium]|nr:efflux RND transporter periplasmic adaptor subunit [Candidatus Beckwithbacteria bacterium]
MKLPNPFKWSLKAKLIILFVILAAGGGGYYYYTKQNTKTASEIQTTTVEKGNLISSVTLSGQIEQSNLISVSTKASGEVKEVFITDGQEVAAGDKIAEITLDTTGVNNQSSAWASYLNAKKNVDSATATQYSQQASMFSSWDDYMKKTEETNFDDPNSDYRNLPEFKILQDQWLASEENYKLQAININSAQASLSSAWYNYQLYQATVTAPVAGKIVGLNIAEGLSLVGSENSSGGAVGQTVASIKTDGNPIASFTATEVDINQLKSGQKATLTLDSVTDKTYQGTIVAIDRVGTMTSGVTQYTVLIRFDESDDSVLTNMALTADITLDKRNDVLVIPVGAVVDRNGEKIVRVMKNGQVQPVQVETGLETDTEVEIVSGLSEGDVIISSTSGTGTSGSSDKQGSGLMIPGMGGGGGGAGMVRGTMTPPMGH